MDSSRLAALKRTREDLQRTLDDRRRELLRLRARARPSSVLRESPAAAAAAAAVSFKANGNASEQAAERTARSGTDPTISAIGQDVVIRDIGASGPEDMVRMKSTTATLVSTTAKTTTAIAMLTPLSRASIATEDETSPKTQTVDLTLVSAAPQDHQTDNLYAATASSDSGTETSEPRTSGRTESQNDRGRNEADTEHGHRLERERSSRHREELRRQKAKAQLRMDIVHWKHYIRKQETLLLDVSARIQQSTDEQEQCRRNLHSTTEHFAAKERDMRTLVRKIHAVERLRQRTTRMLLDSRNRLRSADSG